jgi:hypothetical protein
MLPAQLSTTSKADESCRYAGIVLATYGYNYFGLFLKWVTNPDGSKRWTTEQVNLIPIGGGAINMTFVWIWAILSDVLQTRWTLIMAQGQQLLVYGSMDGMLTICRCYWPHTLYYHEHLDVSSHCNTYFGCLRKLLHQLHVLGDSSFDHGLDCRSVSLVFQHLAK